MTIRHYAAASVLTACWCVSVAGGDWAAYRGNAQRTGVTNEALAFPLHEQWAWQSPSPPRPAWPQPGKELHRIDVDYAFQPIVAGGRVLFCSSADDTVRALDLHAGRALWHVTTGAPLRFAPAVSGGKVYVAGDDGFVRCLRAGDGSEVWRFRAAPSADMLLGNGRMISRWPLRSGVLVEDGTVYLTAGMWPSEGVYVYALNADTGDVVWCNDSSGSMYMRFPHPVASGFGGVAPQGYLLASDRLLLVPTGRNVPAAFSRRTGELRYYKSAEALQDGGARATLWRGVVLTPTNRFASISEARVGEAQPTAADGVAAYSLETGRKLFRVSGRYQWLAAPDALFSVGGGVVEAFSLSGWDATAGKAPTEVKWRRPHTSRVYTTVLARDVLLLGGPGRVDAYNANTGEPVWHETVEGQVRGLAVAGQCLVVATDRGSLACFAAKDAPPLADRPTPTVAAGPSPDMTRGRTVLRSAGAVAGHALVLGESDSALALAIATQSALDVINVIPPPADLTAQRRALLGTGLYGRRLTTCQTGTGERLSFSRYFASLVVLTGPGEDVSPPDVGRVLRPCGGVLICPDMTAAQLKGFARAVGLEELQVQAEAKRIVRGKLPGAGEWRYPWGDGGRSGIGREQRVRLPLGLLWFGGPGPDRMMDRHLATAPPLATNGRAFVTGEHHVIAFDAYTGRELWSRTMRGGGRRYTRYYASNFVADDDSVYVARQGECRRLGQAGGDVRAVFGIPDALLGEPDTPKLRQVAEREPWRHEDRRYRLFLAVPPRPPGSRALVLQTRVDIEDVLARVGAQGNTASSVQMTLAGEDLPTHVEKQSARTLVVRAPLPETAPEAAAACVYFGAGGRTDNAPTSSPVLDRLIAAYTFDDGATEVRDISGNGHNGCVDGVSFVPGRTGRSASFDGKTSFCLVKPDAQFNVARGLTVLVWVRLDRAAAGTVLYKAYQYGLYVKQVDGAFRFVSCTRSGDFFDVAGTTVIEPGTWYHVAMTHDGQTQRLYVNGQLEGTGEQGELTTSSNHLCMGASCYGPPKVYSHLCCSLDDVRLYSRAMERAEIRGSMQGAIPAVLASTPTWLQERGAAVRPIRDWEKRGWGYLSVADGLVLGSYTAAPVDTTASWMSWAESAALFALDKANGSVRWTWKPTRGLCSNEIVHADGVMYLLDATATSDLSTAKRRGEPVDVQQDLIALRLRDGSEVWRQPDVPVPGHRTYTPKDAPNYLFIPWRSQLQVAHGVVVVDSIAGYAAETGTKLWQRDGGLRKLSVIHGDRLIVPPYAYGLRTGARCVVADPVTGSEGPWRFIRAYGCGAAVGCRDLLCFRSGSFGFLDLAADGTTTVAGGKPSCNVSMVPANGLVIVPEGSSGCACSYNFQTSLALVPVPRSRDVWYTFPAVSPWGQVRQLRLNFGAPGDRRDAAGNAWLGFPRPQLNGVCPAPVSIRMAGAEYFYTPRVQVDPESSAPAWLYHCGLRGSGTVSIDLLTHPGVSVPSVGASPVIDGDPGDACWRAARPIPFEDSARIALAPSVELKMLRDAEHVYALCIRHDGPTTAEHAEMEAFHLFFTGPKRKNGARFGLSAAGTVFEEGGAMQRRRNLDGAWDGAWTGRSTRTPQGWCAEMAIPLATLEQVGLHPDALHLNGMARLMSDHGLQEIYLADPTFVFAHCCRFLPVTKPPPSAAERSFVVRLHFSEPDRAPPGKRVFDVTLQGRPAVTALDIARETDGKAAAIVKELRGIRARGRITVGISSDVGLPVLNAIEIAEE